MAVLNDFAPQFLLDKRPSKPNRYAIRYVRGLIPVTIVWPTVTAITYGQTVGESVLVGGSATTPWGSNAPGTFSWADPAASLNAGSYNLSVIFTPNKPKTFETIADNRPLVINKITTTVFEWPTASGITYEQSLNDSTLSGGAAAVGGTFEWVNAGDTPNAGTANQSARFVPTDATNYTTVTGNVSVVTAKATPTVTTWPTSSQINYGQVLSSSTLNGGLVSTAGSFSWTTGSIVPNHSVNYAARFVPTDTANYNVVSGTVHLLVVKTHAPGFVSALNGGTIGLNMVGAYVINAKARWQGWNKTTSSTTWEYQDKNVTGTNSSRSTAGSASGSVAVPSVTSGWQAVYCQAAATITRNATSGGSYSATINGSTVVSGSNFAFSSYTGVRDVSPGFTANMTFTRATSGFSYTCKASLRQKRGTTTTTTYNTINPGISYAGGGATHWATMGGGSNSSYYTLTGLQNNALNTIVHSIGGSAQAYIDLQVTYYTTG